MEAVALSSYTENPPCVNQSIWGRPDSAHRSVASCPAPFFDTREIASESRSVDSSVPANRNGGGALAMPKCKQLPDAATLTQTGGTVRFNGKSETLANYTKLNGATSTGGSGGLTKTGDGGRLLQYVSGALHFLGLCPSRAAAVGFS